MRFAIAHERQTNTDNERWRIIVFDENDQELPHGGKLVFGIDGVFSTLEAARAQQAALEEMWSPWERLEVLS